jgi:hypothetical protein
MARQIVASKQVPNGRWPAHNVSVVNYDGQWLYYNGWSDPLACDDEAQAMRYFDENEGTP